MSESLLEEARRHSGLANACVYCGGRWPCLTRRLADRVEELEAENRNLWDRARDEKDRVWAMYEAQKARAEELETGLDVTALDYHAMLHILKRVPFERCDDVVCRDARQALSPPIDKGRT